MTAVCFETPSNYEITVHGRKLVGSAQWRSRGGVLQHGTLPLHGEITRIVDYLALTASERVTQRAALARQALTLQGALGRAISFEQVAESLAAGFGQALNVTWQPGELTRPEEDLVASLVGDQYANSAWLSRR
jgi:lipoate-protein ligase A